MLVEMGFKALKRSVLECISAEPASACFSFQTPRTKETRDGQRGCDGFRRLAESGLVHPGGGRKTHAS